MNPQREESRTLTIVVSSGSGTGTISNSWDVTRRIRVSPPNETATYDFTIKDNAGRLILKRTDKEGTLSEAQQISTGIAKTFVVEEATVDGNYIVSLDMH